MKTKDNDAGINKPKKQRYSKNRVVIYTYSDAEFRFLVANSKSTTEVIKKLGLISNGGNARDFIKKRYIELDIDTTHFNRLGNSKRTKNRKYTCIDDTCYKVSGARNRRIMELLISESVKEYICEMCGCGNLWNGKPITLQLHHIDGNNSNHEVVNLQIVCPNCHTQTNNYGSKNREGYIGKKVDSKNVNANDDIQQLPSNYIKYTCQGCRANYYSKHKKTKHRSFACARKSSRKKDRPTKKVLYSLLLKEPNFVLIGNIYSVSDTTVRNWCKQYSIPYHSKYYRDLQV